MVGTLQTETATLQAEDRGALVAEIDRRMKAAPDGTFLYLLLDAQGRRLTGTIPSRAAHPGWGEVVMCEHPHTPTDPERPERLATLGTRLADGSLLVVATDGYDVDKLGGHMIRFTILWAVAITLLALAGIRGRARTAPVPDAGQAGQGLVTVPIKAGVSSPAAAPYPEVPPASRAC